MVLIMILLLGSQIRRKTAFLRKINPSYAAAQTPCVYRTQKRPDLYDRKCFN